MRNFLCDVFFGIFGWKSNTYYYDKGDSIIKVTNYYRPWDKTESDGIDGHLRENGWSYRNSMHY